MDNNICGVWHGSQGFLLKGKGGVLCTSVHQCAEGFKLSTIYNHCMNFLEMHILNLSIIIKILLFKKNTTHFWSMWTTSFKKNHTVLVATSILVAPSRSCCLWFSITLRCYVQHYSQYHWGGEETTLQNPPNLGGGASRAQKLVWKSHKLDRGSKQQRWRQRRRGRGGEKLGGWEDEEDTDPISAPHDCTAHATFMHTWWDWFCFPWRMEFHPFHHAGG